MLFVAATSLLAAVAVNAANFNVVVGQDATTQSTANAFNPSSISNVTVGDTITFEFGQNNIGHDVTQSTFNSPCVPANGGYSSGLATGNIVYNVTVSGSLWFECSQSTHCAGSGMVFAVNPGSANSSTSFADFQGIAMNTVNASTTLPAPTFAATSTAQTSSAGAISSAASAGASSSASATKASAGFKTQAIGSFVTTLIVASCAILA